MSTSSGSGATRGESIEVVVRTRPTSTPASELVSRGGGVLAVGLGKAGGINAAVDNKIAERQFQFDNVLGNSSQEQVYDLAAKDIVENVLQGYNGTIMASVRARRPTPPARADAEWAELLS